MIVHTLAYNEPEVVVEAIESCHRTAGPFGYCHVLVECGYPVEDPMVWQRMAKRYGIAYLDLGGNYGVADNWNRVAELMQVDDNEVLFGYDPDTRIRETGWVGAIQDVMEKAADVAYVYLNHRLLNTRPEIMDEELVAGHRCWRPKSLTNWSCGGFRGGFVKRYGLRQKRDLYGFVEHETMPVIEAAGMRVLVLRDYHDDYVDPNKELRRWKQLQVAGCTAKDYREWRDEARQALKEISDG